MFKTEFTKCGRHWTFRKVHKVDNVVKVRTHCACVCACVRVCVRACVRVLLDEVVLSTQSLIFLHHKNFLAAEVELFVFSLLLFLYYMA